MQGHWDGKQFAPYKSIRVKPCMEPHQGRASFAHLPNDFYILRQPQAPAEQSKMPCVKRIQLFRQSLGIFFIYHMAGVFQHPQLRVRNVLGQEMR